MSTPSEHLRRWRDAGLVDESTVARVLEFESANVAAAPAAESVAGRPGVAEALVYLAAAVIGVGVWVLAGVSWESFNGPTRISIMMLSAAAALVSGAVMWRTDDARLRRGAGVVWLLAAILCALAAALIGDEAGIGGEDNALIAAGVSLVVSGVLCGISKRHPQVVALFSAGLFGAIAVTLRGDLDTARSLFTFGGVAALGGVVAIVGVEGGVLHPRSSGRVFSALLLAIGATTVGFPPVHAGAEPLTFAAGGALIALSFWRHTLVYIGFGVMVVFVALVTAVLRHIDDPALAAVALIVVGLMLIFGVLLASRLRTRVSAEPVVLS